MKEEEETQGNVSEGGGANLRNHQSEVRWRAGLPQLLKLNKILPWAVIMERSG